jgi:hypothetical protein
VAFIRDSIERITGAGAVRAGGDVLSPSVLGKWSLARTWCRGFNARGTDHADSLGNHEFDGLRAALAGAVLSRGLTWMLGQPGGETSAVPFAGVRAWLGTHRA